MAHEDFPTGMEEVIADLEAEFQETSRHWEAGQLQDKAQQFRMKLFEKLGSHGNLQDEVINWALFNVNQETGTDSSLALLGNCKEVLVVVYPTENDDPLNNPPMPTIRIITNEPYIVDADTIEWITTDTEVDYENDAFYSMKASTIEDLEVDSDVPIFYVDPVGRLRLPTEAMKLPLPTVMRDDGLEKNEVVCVPYGTYLSAPDKAEKLLENIMNEEPTYCTLNSKG